MSDPKMADLRLRFEAVEAAAKRANAENRSLTEVAAALLLEYAAGRSWLNLPGEKNAADGHPPIAITPAQFSELKAMLDADAGKEHSASGPASSSLQRILARHQQMVLESAAQFARSRAELAVKNGWDGTALYRFAEMLDGES
jgi:hypothetical protein